MTTSPTPRQSDRLYDVDWLRIIATLGVFAYHCGRMFDTMEPWHVKNNLLTDFLTYPMGFGSQFAMPLFFVLSGMSTRFALGARPAGEFLRKRFLRLAVPVVTLGWFVLSPPQVYIEAVTNQGYNAPPFQGTFWQFLGHYVGPLYGRGGYFAWTGMHLWYMFWLLVFSVLLLPLFLFLRSERGQGVVSTLAGWMSKPGVVLLLGLPMLLPELLLGPSKNLFLSWEEAGWKLGTYAIILLTGFLFASDARFRASLQRHRWVALALAVGSLVPLVMWALNMGDLPFYSIERALKFGLRTINGWWWLVAILGFGSLHLNVAKPALAYIGPAVLPFYMLHQTVIVILGYFIRDWPLAVLPKYLLVVLLVLGINMALYEFLIRRHKVLRFLFGMTP